MERISLVASLKDECREWAALPPEAPPEVVTAFEEGLAGAAPVCLKVLEAGAVKRLRKSYNLDQCWCGPDHWCSRPVFTEKIFGDAPSSGGSRGPPQRSCGSEALGADAAAAAAGDEPWARLVGAVSAAAVMCRRERTEFRLEAKAPLVGAAAGLVALFGSEEAAAASPAVGRLYGTPDCVAAAAQSGADAREIALLLRVCENRGLAIGDAAEVAEKKCDRRGRRAAYFRELFEEALERARAAGTP